jgi:hypothetical protein
LEEDLQKLEKLMGDVAKFGTPEYKKAMDQHASTKKELEGAMAEWEAAEMELENFG